MAFANFNPSKIINDFQSERDQSERDQSNRDQSERDQSNRDHSERDQSERDQSNRDHSGDRDKSNQMLFTFDSIQESGASLSKINDSQITNETRSSYVNMKKEQDYAIAYLRIHQNIVLRLDEFIAKNQIPHIIFHGPSGSGKQTLVREFIQRIYGGDKLKLKTHVMTVNCSHGKGIQFIREELKFFAKSNAQTKSNVDGGKSVEFKVIMLLNAHHLTVDAQSALRRCIELFSYNTRFFIVVENKDKLLNPILSRFCDIFVPEPTSSSSSYQNLHQYVLSQRFQDMEDQCREDTNRKMMELNNAFGSSLQNNTKDRIETVNRFYESGISCLDVMEWVKTQRDRWSKDEYYRAIMRFYQIKPQFRCEKLLILFMVNYLFRK